MAIFIPEDKVTEIKSAVDIVDIVSEAVLLKKAGKNFVGLCPFHSEKTPSFTVSPDKQIFYCFGCGTGGNVFSFLMKQEGLAFPEAAKRLAKRYGIDLPVKPLSPQQKRQISIKEKLLHVNSQAMGYYHDSLIRKRGGERANTYLMKRGISQQTIDNFKLGYAPDGWDNLVRFFDQKRKSSKTIEKCGLILSRKDQRGYYDRFRNRIIFPIFDVNMQVIGFGGRVLDDSLPKYLNSPETPVYSKSKSLYGIQRARDKCRSTGTVFIVEGYLDLLALHQHGIENSVATLGTALTSDHVRLLTRYARRMILVFDSDEAGIRSAQRCIATFWKEHVDFRREDVFKEEKADTHIMVLPEGHDPDSYVFEYGPESFLEAASRSPGVITFLMDSAINTHGLSVEGKIRVISELQAPLAAINDSVARSLYIKQLSERIDIEERAILERIRRIPTDPGRDGNTGNVLRASTVGSVKKGSQAEISNAEVAKGIRTGNRLERQIIAMMLQFPDILPDIRQRGVLEYFENNALKSIGELILEFHPDSVEQVSELISKIDDQEQRTLVAALAMIEESWNTKGCLQLLTRFVGAGQKQRSRGVLEKQIETAERNNDHKLLLKLLQEKQKMAVRSEKQKMAILNEK
ncbi:MAG: DNA primase [Desulfobacterales bacterium]